MTEQEWFNHLGKVVSEAIRAGCMFDPLDRNVSEYLSDIYDRLCDLMTILEQTPRKIADLPLSTRVSLATKITAIRKMLRGLLEQLG